MSGILKQPHKTKLCLQIVIKPLGQNSVTFKGTQMIVSGPDMAQAKAIAKELSTGQGRLASYNGEQVLISMTTAEGMMMSRNNCFCKNSKMLSGLMLC